MLLSNLVRQAYGLSWFAASTRHRMAQHGRTYATTDMPVEAAADNQAASPQAEQEKASSTYTGPAKLVVFGGRGFVGSAVCQEGLAHGYHVIGASRSGEPSLDKGKWVKEVEWKAADAKNPASYKPLLENASAVISCIGGFGSQEQMMQINGHTNVELIKAAHDAGVPRFVYISAHIPNIPGIDYVLGGYIKGKELAEAAVKEHFPNTGMILRPGMIYGTRHVSKETSLPLSVVGRPLEMILGYLPARQLSWIPILGAPFITPVSDKAVAKAAIHAAIDPMIQAGVMDVWEIAKYR